MSSLIIYELPAERDDYELVIPRSLCRDGGAGRSASARTRRRASREMPQ